MDDAETERDTALDEDAFGEIRAGERLRRCGASGQFGLDPRERPKDVRGDVLSRFAAEAPDVAACRSVGGAVALAFAFALVAAIIAEVDGFFGTGVDIVELRATLAPAGFAFSSCFDPVESSVIEICWACAGHIVWKSQ